MKGRMKERVSKLVRIVGEMRGKLKKIEGKYYRMGEKNKILEKRVELLQEESYKEEEGKEDLKGELGKKRR